VYAQMIPMPDQDNGYFHSDYIDFILFGRLNNSPPQFGHLNSNESEHSGHQVHS
jgi:hypothetical protein